MKLKLLLFLFTFSILKVSAQGLPCRATEENAKIFRDNPSVLQEKKDFDAFSKKFASDQKNNSSKLAATTYTIPVVFHIYGETQSGKSVTYQKIVNHLAQLNDDFNGRNADYQTVESFFQARRATLNIEFKLAKIDPNGACTSGVVFHPAKNGYGNGGGYDDQIAADAWDNKKYMNIYIQNQLYNDGVFNNSGVAWYPTMSMTNSNTARVVFNGAYLYDNTNHEFSATLTHEFGHFMNLIHTFDGGCTGTDEVDDTPVEDGKHTLKCTPGTNCNGDKVNIENYMGYNGADGCYKMFTQGQVTRMLAALQHPARITLWQPQNLIDTGVSATGSTLIASTNLFKEEVVNDGSFATNSVVTLEGTKKFALSSGVMVAGTHFTHTFPAGITPVLTVNTNSQLTLTLSGKANAHAAANSTKGVISFLDAAFSGGTSTLNCTKLGFDFSFKDAYGIFFVDMPDITVSSALTWKFFEIEKGDDARFGAWRLAVNALKLESYKKKLVCETGTRNISLLAANVAVGPGSNFTASGTGTNQQLDIRTADYTVWDGKSGYVGFDYLLEGATCYGWFKITVNANGDAYTISDYAYNTEPGKPIYTGMAPKVNLALAAATLYETDNNDGAITSTTTLTLATNNGTFTKSSGTFTLGTDYTITGVPLGLTAVLTLQNNTTAVLSFTGKATSHVPANDANVVIAFKDAAITGGIAVLADFKKTISLKFEIPYGIYFVNNPDYTVSAASTWQYLNLSVGDNTEYGAWRFAQNNLKIETYGKRLVSELGTKNISFIAEGTSIGATSNFVAPGAYPNQLDLRTATYTVWDNKTAYVGFEYTSRGRICYGWLHVKVDADGNGYTILDFAYNTKPNAPILAGAQVVADVLAPANLAATVNTTAFTAALTWTNNASNATNVIVERAGADNVFAVIATLPSTATTYTNTGLVNQVVYKYRVKATTATLTSAYSNEAFATIGGTIPVSLQTPTGLEDAGIFETGFYAAWRFVTGATSYEVQLKSGANWVTVGTSTEDYFLIDKQGSQMIYEFRVRALNGTAYSDWSTSLIVNLNPLGLTDVEKQNNLFVMYPNPASESVQFNFKSVEVTTITITIYNTNGNVVDVVKNATSYNVNHLAKGMYIVVVTDGKFTAKQKLVIN